MPISLSKHQIEKALVALQPGLQKYLLIQRQVSGGAVVCETAEFKKRFNGFYRIRRGAAWQQAFYSVFAKGFTTDVDFASVLRDLCQLTGRWEASFASKLVATFCPTEPVLDSVVLKNVGLRLPYASSMNRAAAICTIHETLGSTMRGYLESADGMFVVSAFRSKYPTAAISEMKILDLVLWQTRPQAS